MTIVVGYTPTAAGRAALLAAAGAARKEDQALVVVNSSRGDALADPGFAQEADLDWARATLDEAGVEFSIRQPVQGREASEEALAGARGGRRRAVRDRDPAPDRGRQDG